MHDSYREGFGNQTGERPGTKPALNKLLQTTSSAPHWNEDFTVENGYYGEKLKIMKALVAEVGKDGGNERSVRPTQNNES